MCDLLRPLLPLLRPGAAVIMTLKFYGRGAGREGEWRQAIAEQLGPDFERVQLLWLLANTQHEQTAIAFKKGAVPLETSMGAALPAADAPAAGEAAAAAAVVAGNGAL
jgi:hypothetical protein